MVACRVGRGVKETSFFPDRPSSSPPLTTRAVCGIETAPRKVTRSMNKKTIKRKTKVKPFIKAINYTHILPTRCVQLSIGVSPAW